MWREHRDKTRCVEGIAEVDSGFGGSCGGDKKQVARLALNRRTARQVRLRQYERG